MRFLLFLSLLLSGCISQKSNTENFPLIASIDVLVDSTGFNGVILVSRDNKILFSKVKGFSSLEDSTLLTIDNQFVIGSISKQITAVLVMQAYEQGLLALDDKLSSYLPELNQPWAQEISIHQLLTHTHGIESLDQPLQFEPGSQFQYSQLGYHLLGRILERVHGRSFQQLASALFRKHKLDHTFHPDAAAAYTLVKGYEQEGNGPFRYQTQSLQNYAAAGSFISNAADLNRWNQLLHARKLVNAESLRLMKTAYATRVHPIYGTVEYGYGLLFQKGEEDLQLGTLGYAPGFVSASYYYPQTGFSLVVLENTARHLWELDKTFGVHTRLMELVKDDKSLLAKSR